MADTRSSFSKERAAKRAKLAPGYVEKKDDGPVASIIVQFESMDDEALGPHIDIPLNSTVEQMEQIINQLLENGDEVNPYTFYVEETEVTGDLAERVSSLGLSTETTLKVKFQPQAVFRVRPVTRCTDTMPGHTEAVLHVSFSPDGLQLASGGGDACVRFWDVNTATPKFTCRGHKHWVLCTAWSPNGKMFVSGDRNGEIRLWEPATGKLRGKPMNKHKQWVTAFSWQPMHRNADCELFASSSKDATIKLWNARTGSCLVSLSGHIDSVESVKWGGQGLLYSASRDRTIKVGCADPLLI
jgi:ribosome assembly protein 4